MSWLAFACLVSVQDLDDKTTSLPEGRLTIRAPKGAKIEARRAGIMAAPEAAAEETRVVWSDGESKLVIMAYELFQIAGKDFAQGAKDQMASWELDWTEGSRRHSEAMFSLPGGDGRMIHVFHGTLDPEEVDVLKAISDSLDLVPAK